MNIVVFASGRGSNFKAILENIESGKLRNVKVSLLISDKPQANVLSYASQKEIPNKCIDASKYASRDAYEKDLLEEVKAVSCDMVVLAGYMKVIGPDFINQVGCPIVNIHPSLLPSFPGLHAQKQAVDYGVKVSGCTVHFVDAELDHGPIIAQKAVPVLDDDNEDTLSARILVEEHKLYTECLQLLANNCVSIEERRVKISIQE